MVINVCFYYADYDDESGVQENALIADGTHACARVDLCFIYHFIRGMD